MIIIIKKNIITNLNKIFNDSKSNFKKSFDYFISILFDLNQLNLNKKIIKKKAKK